MAPIHFFLRCSSAFTMRFVSKGFVFNLLCLVGALRVVQSVWAHKRGSNTYLVAGTLVASDGWQTNGAQRWKAMKNGKQTQSSHLWAITCYPIAATCSDMGHALFSPPKTLSAVLPTIFQGFTSRVTSLRPQSAERLTCDFLRFHFSWSQLQAVRELQALLAPLKHNIISDV